MKQELPAGGGRYYVSEKKQLLLYKAIDDPIMDLRLTVQKSALSSTSKEILDKKLFDLSITQWKSISQILKIKNP